MRSASLRLVLAGLGLVAATTASSAVAQSPMSVATAPTACVAVSQSGALALTEPCVAAVVGAGIQKITATPGQGWRSILVQSTWGYSYFGWPRDVKALPFTIEAGRSGVAAAIGAPDLNDSNKTDYRTAIEAVIPQALTTTEQNRRFMEADGS